MKKIILGLFFLFTLVCVFLSNEEVINANNNCYLRNYYNICINEQEYQNLLNLGFTDFEINNLEESEFEKNKDIVGEIVAETIKYYEQTYFYLGNQIASVSEREITKAEYDSARVNKDQSSLIRSSGYIETTYKQLRTVISTSGVNYRYKVTLNWKILPSARSYDIISLGIEPAYVYLYGNETFSQTYCTSSNNCTNSSVGIMKYQETGVAVSFDLPSGTFTTLSSYLYFDVEKDTDLVTQMSAYGDYAHAITNVTQYQSTCFSIVGAINLESNVINKYDEIDEAIATWYGTW